MGSLQCYEVQYCIRVLIKTDGSFGWYTYDAEELFEKTKRTLMYELECAESRGFDEVLQLQRKVIWLELF